MALSFPRDLTTAHRWESAPLNLPQIEEVARTAVSVQVRSLAPAIWRGSYTSVVMPAAEAGILEANLLSLRGRSRTFYAHTATRSRPLKYVAGDISTASVHSIRGDRQALRIAGLPRGLALSPNDFLSVATGIGGLELFRVVTGGATSSEGLSPWMEVVPNVRPTVVEGDVVNMDRPLHEVRLADDFEGAEPVNVQWHRISFTTMQVLR